MACSTPTNVRETDMAVKNEASTFTHRNNAYDNHIVC